METMEENGWSLPAAIGTVVGKLHAYLEIRSDSGKFKGTMKMLDLLEEKRDLLSEENLQRVKIDREEDLAAWLRLVKVATDDAEEVVNDMEAEATAGESATLMFNVLALFRDSSSIISESKVKLSLRLRSGRSGAYKFLYKLGKVKDPYYLFFGQLVS
jgi:hypothetical protein